MKTIDLTDFKVVTEGDLARAVREGVSGVRICSKAILTPAARDYASGNGLTLEQVTPGGSSGAGLAAPALSPEEAIFRSAEAMTIKQEIMRVGRKLWERQYVDGNGGNISVKLNDRYILCTPTLCSKADLTPDDFALVDMEGNQVAGDRPRSSELALHLEMYKANPKVKAIVHCHPPHATAYALTGMVPPECLIPEHEVFVGSVAMAPYETPGTPAFAQTVLPYVQDHNMILLQNHGVVTWADTVTHAEWYAEVVDTYCRTIVIASHLGVPLVHIPNNKAVDLLEIKKKLGLPDPRFGLKECQLCDVPEFPDGISVKPRDRRTEPGSELSSEDLEGIVKSITDQVMAALKFQA
jgi:L-fuculose-phosphate aldolase